MTEQHIKDIQGLTSQEAKELQNKYGKNELVSESKESFFHKIFKVISEPMFLLLIVASIIYFILGEPRDGCIMLVFVVGIIGIEVIQEWKTDKTLSALKDLSAPRITVLRDGDRKVINSSELVPGDVMYIAEGIKIPADGFVISASTLRVDESSLTGEAEGVWKVTSEECQHEDNDYWRKDYCYAGTLVTQGLGTILVDKIGTETEYGKISRNIVSAQPQPTPLQTQTGVLVKICAGIAAALFLLVAFVTYLNISDHSFTERIIESILSGVTLAMAMIPEEFPVILTVFLSMGAWRLARKKSIVRKLPSVETLGAVSVLCVDKTGTITLNKMTVSNTWTIFCEANRLNLIMGMACELDAYDPMERAMINFCEEHGISRDILFGGELIKEYAFTNELKMMAHVWRNNSEIVVAAKGSPESIINICNISAEDRLVIEKGIRDFSKQGLRVIAVGEMVLKNENDIPDNLEDCSLNFCGLIGLADPPRDSVKADIETCTNAGVRVVMVTGDNGVTASSIAMQINMPGSDMIITGNELNSLSDKELQKKVNGVSIFSRVIPEHKMRIVKAFKANGEVVAMTGDGVNDAPALKYADIGIAMGERGSEVSREAADLILLDDNFSTIVDTIRDGRRIYDNIRKAVEYVVTIHIPIAFSSLFAPLLDINPANLLLFPLHVVLLELIIDPTCSIVLERQPAEDDIMDRKPRSPKEKLLTAKGFSKSIIQGLVIFGASFGTYLIVLNQNPADAALARTMGLAIIFFANMFLVQVNSSNYDYAARSFVKLAKDKVVWAANIVTIVGLLLMLYTPLCQFLKLTPLTMAQFALAFCIGAGSVAWYEFVKLIKHKNTRSKRLLAHCIRKPRVRRGVR